MIGWRVWYDDGKIYVSKTHRWTDVPWDGLMVKIIYYANGTKQIQHGMDWYGVAEHAEGEIHFSTMDSPETVKKRYKNPIMKQGRWGPDDYYKRIVAEAHASKWDN